MGLAVDLSRYIVFLGKTAISQCRRRDVTKITWCRLGRDKLTISFNTWSGKARGAKAKIDPLHK